MLGLLLSVTLGLLLSEMLELLLLLVQGLLAQLLLLCDSLSYRR
jgi:hypothetical protein